MIKAIKKWWLYNPYRKENFIMSLGFFRHCHTKIDFEGELSKDEFEVFVMDLVKSRKLRKEVSKSFKKG